MLVTFVETRRIREDGFTVKRCHAGQTYDLADMAARYAIAREWAYEPSVREVCHAGI